MQHTVDTLIAQADAYADQNYLCAQGEKSDCDTARKALRTALTEALAQPVREPLTAQVLPDFSPIFGGDK